MSRSAPAAEKLLSYQPERKDLPLAAVAGSRHCPLSLAAGSRTPARQLLGECSKEP